jgi:signal transduction histidine kinase
MPASSTAFEQPELFEQQLADLSATFVALPADQVDQQVDWGLQLLLEAMGMDRSSIAEFSADGTRFEVTHTQVRGGISPMPTGNMAELLPWFTETLARGEMLRFDRLPDDLPPEAVAERRYVTSIGLRSQLTIPFRVGERVIGAITFASFGREVRWTPRLVRSVRLIGEVFANALARKHAANDQLRLREQLAHTARVNAMGEVVASIAHEVNQPLFAIVSNARAAGTLLSRGEPDLAEIGAALEDIVQDANRASAIMARIRIFLQRKPTEHLPVDLNAVVETVRTFLGPELARRRVELVAELAGGLPQVLADAVQLQQVLVNLLMNGIDAMEGLEPRQRLLRVRTSLEADERRVRLEVTDAGPGFDPAVRARLFEPFFSTKPSGLGMGLAICRSIVEDHGGYIRPVDHGGPGTTLLISLPVRRP